MLREGELVFLKDETHNSLSNTKWSALKSTTSGLYMHGHLYTNMSTYAHTPYTRKQPKTERPLAKSGVIGRS